MPSKILLNGIQWRKQVSPSRMVENINTLATSFREYMQVFYPQKYTDAEAYTTPSDFLDPYRAVMYMGLQNSQFYRDEVVSAGKDSLYTTYRGVLNALGCGDNYVGE